MLKELIASKVEIEVCGTCMAHRGAFRLIEPTLQRCLAVALALRANSSSPRGSISQQANRVRSSGQKRHRWASCGSLGEGLCSAAAIRENRLVVGLSNKKGIKGFA
ncbi:MAG: DsrE family protein [Lentisphaerae bacterium]|nr:DsrE family protein [Lentisphaerota bacterium]